jgi:succinate dehydrogenase/fumarate reductase flavoprotein subunit
LPDFLKAKGQDDFEKTLVEVMVSEATQAGPSEIAGAGLRIDRNCATSVPGLFAAGDSAHQNRCVHLCTTGGYLAGKRAAAFAGTAAHLDLDAKEVAEESARVLAPLARKAGISYQEFEEVFRKIMTDNLVPQRSEISLKTALAKLGSLEPYREQMTATNLHELMRVHEASNMLKVAKICCHASLARKESRFIPYHHRSDYPEQNDRDFCGLIIVRKGKDVEIQTRFEKLEYNI